MTRAPLPPGHVRITALIGLPPVTREQAERNRKALQYPMRPRERRPGLVPYDAAGLWAAIRRGAFPAPVRGPWGIAWSLDAIYRWRRHKCETPAVGAARGFWNTTGTDEMNDTHHRPSGQSRLACTGCGNRLTAPATTLATDDALLGFLCAPCDRRALESATFAERVKRCALVGYTVPEVTDAFARRGLPVPTTAAYQRAAALHLVGRG